MLMVLAMVNAIPEHVLDRLSDTPEKTLVTNFFYLMKELGLSYDDLCNIPVPTLFLLMEELNSHSKREERALKKKK